MAGETNYNSWTKTGLIKRLKELEGELKRREEGPRAAGEDEIESPGGAGDGNGKTGQARRATRRKIDPSRYSFRFIALKIAYLGKNYGGFEFQAMGSQPSIEEELWNALTKACLIFPEDERVVQFDCCEYSKCGRTDRGVSAFGQVIGLRVRSNRPLAEKRVVGAEEEASGVATAEEETDENADGADREEAPLFDDLRDELCYPRILNRLLPDDIRVLAWCPSPPAGFSARFSCRERQYRYFFTQPAFAPDPTTTTTTMNTTTTTVPGSSSQRPLKPGWLDIEAMRDAAKRFEGDHDFRNFCKIDPAKQISNFRRRIFESDIVEVRDASSALPFLQDEGYASPGVVDPADTCPKVYYFHVRGSAFLWHQIRHMVAVLFLVGQRLESPSVVSELLDADENPRRPAYVMADEVPLVLWDCIFPDLSAAAAKDLTAAEAPAQRTDCMDWIYVGDEWAPNKFGQFGVMESTWRLWRGHKMDELLSAQLLQRISQQGRAAAGRGTRAVDDDGPPGKADASVRIFEGGNAGRLAGRYVPVMSKEKLQSPEEQNDRYARRKGYADAADMRAQKYGGGEKDDEG